MPTNGSVLIWQQLPTMDPHFLGEVSDLKMVQITMNTDSCQHVALVDARHRKEKTTIILVLRKANCNICIIKILLHIVSITDQFFIQILTAKSWQRAYSLAHPKWPRMAEVRCDKLFRCYSSCKFKHVSGQFLRSGWTGFTVPPTLPPGCHGSCAGGFGSPKQHVNKC